MKKISALILILLVFCPFSVFAEEESDDSVLSDEGKKEETFAPDSAKQNTEGSFGFKYYGAKGTRIKSKAYVRPKREHMKTMSQTQKSLDKNKFQFQQRKENELKLLRDEYEILEYNP